MAEHPDDDWIALLAGQDVPHAPEAMKLEAALLRQALAERNEEIDRHAIPTEEIESSLTSMLSQARAQGLLDAHAAADKSKHAAPGPGWLARLAKWFGLDAGQGFMPSMAIAATLVLGIGVAVVMTPERQIPPELERGGPAPAQEAGLPREVADPAVSAHALADALRKLGLTVSVGEDLGFWFVESDVRTADPTGLRTLLEREGLAVPPEGRLKVVFAPKH